MKIFNQAKKLPELYRKCNELPIHNFNEVDTNDDFNFLKKDPEDEVSDSDLQLAWLDILDELIQISKNAHVTNLLKKKVKVILLQRKLAVFEALKYCIDLNIDVTQELKDYKVAREKVGVHIGMIKNDINRLTAGEDSEDGKKKTGQEFENSILILMENGYEVDRFKMVVTTWVLALNRIESKQKLNPNKK